LHLTADGFVQAVEFLLPVTAAKFIIKSSLFILLLNRYSSSPELKPGFALKLIALPSATLVQNRLLPEGFLLLFLKKKLSGSFSPQLQLIENILFKLRTDVW
jgi:hypothetical protein